MGGVRPSQRLRSIDRPTFVKRRGRRPRRNSLHATRAGARPADDDPPAPVDRLHPPRRTWNSSASWPPTRGRRRRGPAGAGRRRHAPRPGSSRRPRPAAAPTSSSCRTTGPISTGTRSPTWGISASGRPATRMGTTRRPRRRRGPARAGWRCRTGSVLVGRRGASAPPQTLDEYRQIGARLKQRGRPVGQALSHTLGDAPAWTYPILWAFGGAEVDASGGRVVLDSRATLESVK